MRFTLIVQKDANIFNDFYKTIRVEEARDQV